MSWSIYRIYSDKGDLQYYGSTTMDIKKRFRQHKSDIHRKQCSSFILFETYGIENCYIEVIEEGADNTQLDRESYYILNNKCVNKVLAKRSKCEWYKANKERIQEKYQANKEKILAKCKIQYALKKNISASDA
jgi:hypothetical protein